MVAKKPKGWRSGKREGRSRMVQMTRHLVVSEGKETEPRYFEGVRAALGAANERKVAIVVKGNGKHTLDLLDFAVEHCRYAPETFDHVWLVYDKDDFPASDFDAIECKCNELSDGSRPSMRCGRTPASSCGRFCTFATRPRICPRPTASMPSRRRCRGAWASSTARTWTGCLGQWMIGEAKLCSVLGASSRTIGNWVTLSHLRKTLQLRWARYSM